MPKSTEKQFSPNEPTREDLRVRRKAKQRANKYSTVPRSKVQEERGKGASGLTWGGGVAKEEVRWRNGEPAAGEEVRRRRGEEVLEERRMLRAR
jgi:hypothetical protein